MIDPAMFSSKKTTWETPHHLFNKVNAAFNFDIDVCCDKDNKKTEIGIQEEDDALIQNWTEFYLKQTKTDCMPGKRSLIAWMNPPYKRFIISKWLAKAQQQAEYYNVFTVALLPGRTDTRWFHDYVYNKPFVSIRCIKGRLNFVNAKTGAPFPSILVTFSPPFIPELKQTIDGLPFPSLWDIDL